MKNLINNNIKIAERKISGWGRKNVVKSKVVECKNNDDIQNLIKNFHDSAVILED